MKVLLISANTVRVPYPVYPLGLDYVAGAIAKRHIVKTIDINLFKEAEELKKIIHDFAPDLIGLSLRNVDNVEAAHLLSFLKKYQDVINTVRGFSPAPIVLGGSGFTIFPRKLMDFLKADYGIIGEGERLSALIDALESGKPLINLPGVISGDSPEIFPPPWKAPIKKKRASEEIMQFYIAHGGMMNLQTKRGCPYRCIYCTYPHIEGRKLRMIPPDQVADQAKALESAGAKYLFVTDSLFNSSYTQSLEVAEAFLRKGISIPWGAYLAPTTAPQGYYQRLREAGMTHVEFGTESLSDSVLAAYQKPFQVTQAMKSHARAVEAGLNVAHFLLLGGPGETRETVEETLRNIEKLAKSVFFFFCGVRIYPQTQLYDLALEEGQITESDGLLEPVFYRSRYISSQEINDLVKEKGKGRENWVIGSGGNRVSRMLARLYKQGAAGPLWELKIR
ncbi:MAG TPA: lipid biosynthesis B12-binding/radical SAM protein [Thermodesulfobacteriota bacterium]|nr:lipid biosynthesis B12-binding/radical SAM protein [Thermodesulfobacteriota bacterium]